MSAIVKIMIMKMRRYALGSKKDMLFNYNTCNRNLNKAVNTANDKGMITIALTGATGFNNCANIKVSSKG